MLHIGASDLSTEMGIPGQYTHARMREAFETVARAAKGRGKAMGVGGVRQDFEFQSWLLRFIAMSMPIFSRTLLRQVRCID